MLLLIAATVTFNFPKVDAVGISFKQLEVIFLHER